MRAALLLLTLLVLGGVGFWLMQSGPEPSLPPGGGGAEGETFEPGAGGSPAGSLPTGVVARRTEAVDIDPGYLCAFPGPVLLEANAQRVGPGRQQRADHVVDEVLESLRVPYRAARIGVV